MLKRVGQSLQVAIPKAMADRLGLHVNDYLDIRVEGLKIIMEPQVVVPKDQAFFYTKEWQEDEKKADDDIKKGRVTRSKNLQDLFRQLDE